jgi:hypothetical protein
VVFCLFCDKDYPISALIRFRKQNAMAILAELFGPVFAQNSFLASLGKVTTAMVPRAVTDSVPGQEPPHADGVSGLDIRHNFLNSLFQFLGPLHPHLQPRARLRHCSLVKTSKLFRDITIAQPRVPLHHIERDFPRLLVPPSPQAPSPRSPHCHLPLNDTLQFLSKFLCPQYW